MIKLIGIEQLKPGMYVHDVNCGWLDHDFIRNRFPVKDEATVAKVRATGVKELYIDTARGLDAADAPTREQTQQAVTEQLHRIRAEPAAPHAVAIAEELQHARSLHRSAHRTMRRLMHDLRLGRQIEVGEVEPLVGDIVASVFRQPGALVPLARLKHHDDYTYLHSVSTCALMAAFGRQLKLSREYVKELALGALLHDVGKMVIDERILKKPGKLTDAEFAQMKTHVVQSKLILQGTAGVSGVAVEVAALHHERFDGSGYPNGLAGDAIALSGQMAAIVDVFDAITSERVYHHAIAPTEALRKLLEWSRFHFKPELVHSFVRAIGIYPTGSLVRLESGRLAVVLEQHPDTLLLPRVRVVFHADAGRHLPPEELDLRHGTDGIVGQECFQKWKIDPQRWLER